ncbi:alpha/beta fold hydrolase [Streptomyces monticola]|uniref:Alpha/beta fold hydrolase n=1 Tax=Streptomyces monticola TaxID=2666263 RepID=A0ABW2JVT2_9ACTN
MTAPTPPAPPAAVVLLHALSLDSGMWAAQTSALRASGHEVLAFDQRGFGTAPLGDVPPSLDVVADDLARALDDRGTGRAVLVGCSMGAYVAMTFLRRHPGRCAALALLSARATADSPEVREQRLLFADLMRDETRRAPVLKLAGEQLVGATTREDRPGLAARVRADAAAADPTALAWAQRAIAQRQDASETLRALRVPAVVLAGAEDDLVTAEESRTTAELLPHGRLVTVPGAGHLPPLESPETVTAELTTLLARTGTPAC